MSKKYKDLKSYTDIDQSRVLATILPLDSADHCFLNDGTATKAEINSYNTAIYLWDKYYVEIIPSWSTSALFEFIPETFIYKDGRHYWFKHTIDEDYHVIEYWCDGVDVGVFDEGNKCLIDLLYKLICWFKDNNIDFRK